MNYELWTMYHETRLTQPIRAAHPFDEILLYICREPSTNQLFYAKQTQFPKKSNDVSFFYTMDYENKHNWTIGQNKANSNPIKPNLRKAKMNVNLTLTKGYRKKDDFVVRINKANSKPISEKPKMSANLYVIEDYENETANRPKKTNPNKPNFFKGQNRLPKNLATPAIPQTKRIPCPAVLKRISLYAKSPGS